MYQEQILDLYKSPRNFGDLDESTHEHHSHNPLCGDEVEMQLKIADGKVVDVRFKGAGCG